jgi:transposase
MIDSFYVKKPGRIAALMMVMTLSLLVYNLAQYKLRQALQNTNETIPNQVGKPIQNPTLKWVFQIMEGVGIAEVYDNSQNLISAVVTNLDELRLKILKLFGGSTSEMYGI